MKEKKLLLGLMCITAAVLSGIKLFKLLLTHETSGVFQNIFIIGASFICAFIFFRQYKKEKGAGAE